VRLLVAATNEAVIATFSVPETYWEYNWDDTLGLRAKFCYLINLYMTQTAEFGPWWQLSAENMSRLFHITDRTIGEGMRDLEKAGLLVVERQLPKDGDYTHRQPSRYLLNPLPSPEETERRWKALEDKWSKAALADAREIAFKIDLGNDHDSVETFLELIQTYGLNKVRKATEMVADNRAGAPTRSIRYIIGILRHHQEERKQD
jgi:hypothetical protein